MAEKVLCETDTRMVKDICKFCKDGHHDRNTDRQQNVQQRTALNESDKAHNQPTHSRSNQSRNQSNPSWGAMFKDRQTFVEMHLV